MNPTLCFVCSICSKIFDESSQTEAIRCCNHKLAKSIEVGKKYYSGCFELEVLWKNDSVVTFVREGFAPETQTMDWALRNLIPWGAKEPSLEDIVERLDIYVPDPVFTRGEGEFMNGDTVKLNMPNAHVGEIFIVKELEGGVLYAVNNGFTFHKPFDKKGIMVGGDTDDPIRLIMVKPAEG